MYFSSRMGKKLQKKENLRLGVNEMEEVVDTERGGGSEGLTVANPDLFAVGSAPGFDKVKELWGTEFGLGLFGLRAVEL